MKILSEEYEQKINSEVSKKEKNAYSESFLELATMTKKERRAAKKLQYMEATADMSKSEKRQYFFSYYKWHFIIPILCVMVICWIFLIMRSNMQPIGLSYAIVNANSAETVDTGFYADYADYQELNNNYREISGFHFGILYDDYIAHESAYVSSNSSNYYGLTSGCGKGDYDIVIGDEDCLNTLAHIGVINMLDDYLDHDTYEALKEHTATAKDFYGEDFIYAIDVSGTEFAKGLNTGYDHVYIMFPGTLDSNKENAEGFADYLINNVFY